VLLALDQSFPTNLIDAMRPFIIGVRLASVRDFGIGLEEMPDWELLLRIDSQILDGDPVAAFITPDGSLLKEDISMVAYSQTKLALIVTASAGHDALISSGLLLAHLPNIQKVLTPRKGEQIWNLKPRTVHPETSRMFLQEMALRRKQDVKLFIRDAELRLTAERAKR
jgi:hypothetical protein